MRNRKSTVLKWDNILHWRTWLAYKTLTYLPNTFILYFILYSIFYIFINLIELVFNHIIMNFTDIQLIMYSKEFFTMIANYFELITLLNIPVTCIHVNKTTLWIRDSNSVKLCTR